MENLNNVKVAVLVENGYEQSELDKPVEALRKAGATAVIVSPQENKVKSWNKKDWGEEINVDQHLNSAKPQDFDALLLPGGVMNPDKLRKNKDAVEFVKHFVQENKPIAAICHGPWTLIEAGGVNGRQMTSYDSIQTDLKNAGANWVDKEVVVDGNLVTSRKPDDIPAFNEKMLQVIAEKVPEKAHH